MKKRVSIALTIIILLTGGLVYANQVPQGGESFAAFYPWSFAITTVPNEPDAAVTLPLTLLDGRQNSKRTDPSLFTADIIFPYHESESESESESDVVIDNGFRVTVTEVEEVGKLDHKGDPIYMYNLAVKVPLTNNFTYQDAHLRLSYNDGSSEELYIGDLSFIYVPENVTPGHLKKLRALPVINMETWEMTALIVEFSVEERLRLEAFDFGLPKYGIDTERVTCLQSGMDKLEKMYSDQTLDQEFESIYTLPKTETREIGLGEIMMEPGLNTLVIPLTFMEEAELSPISALGGLIHYSIDDVTFTYPIETIPYVTGYPPSPIEEYLNDVRH